MAKDGITPKGADSQSHPTEIWRQVPSEPGVLASNLGRVLQQPGYAPLPNGGYRIYTPEPRDGQVARSSKGAKHQYRLIMIKRRWPELGQRPRKVHQLVCEAFHGPKPFPGAVVIHIDENALNNRPENLRWGTQRENLNAPGFIAYAKGRTGENSPGTKGRKAKRQ